MAEKEPVVSHQPQSVSSFTSENLDSKGKCVQLLENTEKFVIQRKVVDNEGKVSIVLHSVGLPMPYGKLRAKV